MPHITGAGKRVGDLLEDQPSKRRTISPTHHGSNPHDLDDVTCLDYDSEYGSENELIEDDSIEDEEAENNDGDQGLWGGDNHKHKATSLTTSALKRVVATQPSSTTPSQPTPSQPTPATTSSGNGSQGVVARLASATLSQPTPSHQISAATYPASEATRGITIWDIALDTIKRYEESIRSILERGGLEGTALSHICLDGFLAAELVMTISTSRQRWEEVLSNANTLVTGSYMVQDHWVSNSMLYLNMTNDTQDLPHLPYNLLSQALLQSQPRGVHPQRIRIQNAEEQPRPTPSRNKKWRHDQCVALLLQYHIGLNTADLAAVMTWLREYQLPYSVPLPDDELLRLIHPYITEALEHIGDLESEVRRPRTTRLLSKRTDGRWAVLLTSPPNSEGGGKAAIPRTSIATFPSFFCPRIAPMGAGESYNNWCNGGLGQEAGEQVFVGLARYGAERSRRGGHFFLVTCPSEPTIAQMEAVRDTVRSQLRKQSESKSDLDLAFAAFHLSGPLFPQQHFRFGSVTQVQAVACWESLQVAEVTKARKLEIKKILKPGPLPEAIILCRTSTPQLTKLCASTLPQLLQVFRALEAQVPGGRQFSRVTIVLEAVSVTQVALNSRKVYAQLPGRFVFASALDRIVRQPDDVITLLQQTRMGEKLFVLDDGLWLNVATEDQEKLEGELEIDLGNSREATFRSWKWRTQQAALWLPNGDPQFSALLAISTQIRKQFDVVVLVCRTSPSTSDLQDKARAWRQCLVQQRVLQRFFPELDGFPVDLLLLVGVSAVNNDELLGEVRQKLKKYNGKRCLFVTTSVDRIARTQPALDRLLGVLQSRHGIMSLVWPGNPGPNGSAEMTEPWTRGVLSQIREAAPRAVFAPALWADKCSVTSQLQALVTSIIRNSESFLGVISKVSKRGATSREGTDQSHLFIRGGTTESRIPGIRNWIETHTDLNSDDFELIVRVGEEATIAQHHDHPSAPGERCGCVSEEDCICPRLCTCSCAHCHRTCIGTRKDGSPCTNKLGHTGVFCINCQKAKSSLQQCQEILESGEVCGDRANGSVYCHRCWKARSVHQHCEEILSNGKVCGQRSNGHKYCSTCRRAQDDQTCQTVLPDGTLCGNPSPCERYCNACRRNVNITLECRVEGCYQRRHNGDARFCFPHFKEYRQWLGGSPGGPLQIQEFVTHKQTPKDEDDGTGTGSGVTPEPQGPQGPQGPPNKLLDCKVEGCSGKRHDYQALWCLPHHKEYLQWLGDSQGGQRKARNFIEHKRAAENGDQVPQYGDQPSHNGDTKLPTCQTLKSDGTPCGKTIIGGKRCRACRGRANLALDCQVKDCSEKRSGHNAVFCRTHLDEYQKWRNGSGGGKQKVNEFIAFKEAGNSA